MGCSYGLHSCGLYRYGPGLVSACAYIGMAYEVMAYAVMAYAVMAYVAMACIGTADIFMARGWCLLAPIQLWTI